MNKAYVPGTAPKDYNFEEDCPHCGSSVPVVIDCFDRTSYEVVCPVCGNKIMLCVLCHWDTEEEVNKRHCDWNPCTGCYRKRQKEEMDKRATDVITFDTYPDMFSDYANHIENDMYDETLRYFSVPKSWAVEYIKREYSMSLDEFKTEYTWDWTRHMYDCAVSEGKVLSEEICYKW